MRLRKMQDMINVPCRSLFAFYGALRRQRPALWLSFQAHRHGRHGCLATCATSRCSKSQRTPRPGRSSRLLFRPATGNMRRLFALPTDQPGMAAGSPTSQRVAFERPSCQYAIFPRGSRAYPYKLIKGSAALLLFFIWNLRCLENVLIPNFPRSFL